MSAATCTIDGCHRPQQARGWCRNHYNQWYRRGGEPRLWMPPTLAERIWARFERQPNGCWLWIGRRNPGGYGKIGVGRCRDFLAHRVVYELLVGPIPEGLELDHLCRTRACVNPVHLEPVSSGENTRRGLAARQPRRATQTVRATGGVRRNPEGAPPSTRHREVRSAQARPNPHRTP